MSATHRSRPGLLTARNLRIAALLLFAGWTLFWGVETVQGILRDSILGRNGIQGIPAFHQVWEVVFVVAYYFMRWVAGAVILGVPLLAAPVVRLWNRTRTRREALSES